MAKCLLVLCALAFAACPSPGASKNGDNNAKNQRISLFMLAELKGMLEPCGCNSDPLGDMARTAALLKVDKQPTLLFDGGSTLFGQNPLPPKLRQQEILKADLVARLMLDLGVTAAGLGPLDVIEGDKGVRFKRHAVNVTSDNIELEPPKIETAGDVRVGVFGVVDRSALANVSASGEAEAARKAIKALREQGAQIIVCLAHMNMKSARRLARAAPGADFILVGQDAPDPSVGEVLFRYDKVGGSYLVQPGNQGQVLAHIDLTFAPGGGLTDAIGKNRATQMAARLDEKIDALAQKISVWTKDKNAEAAFLQQRRDELAQFAKERDELMKAPLRQPATGSWFVLNMIPIRRNLACDSATQAKKQAYDKQVAQVNLASASQQEPLEVADGELGYVGMEECAFCHKEAVTFWRATRHAQAYKTLVDVSKQYDRNCVYCHVTGFEKPGGAALAASELTRDVQCESCHGPGSIHVEDDGKEKPKSLTLAPDKNLCLLSCHTPEHSDTFDYTAYLRDVTGKGHGEAFRKKLGDGPLGGELRQAALKKAGAAIGAKCTK